MEKEEVQEVQETGNKNKTLIWIIIGIACLIVIIVIILILFFFFKGSGKADISPGPGIETIELQDNKLLITRTNLDTQDISKIKFILKDKNNEQYSYETYQTDNTDYELDASDFGLDDFNDIKTAMIIYSYEEAETEPVNPITEEDDFSCKEDSDCDDRINCTRNICDNGVCSYAPDDSCSDGNYCNGLEYCALGEGCIPGTPIDCSSLNEACMQGICSETNKSCVKIPGLNGNSCNDNANCTINDICMNGTCTGTPDNTKCSDNIACTNDICSNKNCSHFPNDFACGSDYKCDIFSGCVQSSCSGCDDCDNFYSDCDYTKCHNNCRKTQDCYFKGGLDSCVTKNYACSNLIRNCSDYNLLECQNDPCNLDCKLEGERCVKEVIYTQCSPWPKGLGYYKDLWVDGGVSLSQKYPTPTINLLNLSADKMMTGSVDVQNPIVIGNAEDKNGVLLYPDDSPRYRIIFVNGGYSNGHGDSLKEEGRVRVRTFFNNGGSYTGSCAGAYLVDSSYNEFFKIWPGRYAEPGPYRVFLSYEFKETSNFLVQEYYKLSNKYTISGVAEYRGPVWDPVKYNPLGTIYLGTITSSTMNGKPPILTYKTNRTGRIVVGTGHPEYATKIEDRAYLLAAMFLYAMDGNPDIPPLKGVLQNNIEVSMNSDNTKIGEKQYHRYTLQIPSNTNTLTISLTGLSDNVDLYVSKDCPPHQNASQYKSENPSTQSESISINNPGAGEWDVSVHGNHNIANGAAYTLKATWQ